MQCDVSDETAVDAVFVRARRHRRAGQQRGVARQPQDPSRRSRSTSGTGCSPSTSRGTFLCARAAVRAHADGGSIVNVASETAFTGSHGFAHYVASKGAVVSLTHALANELGATRHPGQLRRARVHADARLGRARRVRPGAHPARPGDGSRPTCSARSATCCRTTRRSCRVRRSSSTADECRTDRSEHWSIDGRIRRSRRHRARRAGAARRRASRIELVDDAIARTERLEPALNAVIHRQFERARRDAADVTARRPVPRRAVPAQGLQGT